MNDEGLEIALNVSDSNIGHGIPSYTKPLSSPFEGESDDVS